MTGSFAIALVPWCRSLVENSVRRVKLSSACCSVKITQSNDLYSGSVIIVS